MSAILRHPEIVQAVDSFMENAVPAEWGHKRRSAARNWLEGMIVRACDIGAAGAKVNADRSASAHAFGLALGLAQAMDPSVAAEACPNDPASGMKAMVVSHLAALAAGREAA